MSVIGGQKRSLKTIQSCLTCRTPLIDPGFLFSFVFWTLLLVRNHSAERGLILCRKLRMSQRHKHPLRRTRAKDSDESVRADLRRCARYNFVEAGSSVDKRHRPRCTFLQGQRATFHPLLGIVRRHHPDIPPGHRSVRCGWVRLLDRSRATHVAISFGDVGSSIGLPFDEEFPVLAPIVIEIDV